MEAVNKHLPRPKSGDGTLKKMESLLFKPESGLNSNVMLKGRYFENQKIYDRVLESKVKGDMPSKDGWESQGGPHPDALEDDPVDTETLTVDDASKAAAADVCPSFDDS